jgi:hypothetical protein
MGLKRPVEKMYLPTGCAECEYSGYKGRVGVYELLPFDGMVRDAIHSETRTEELMRMLKSVGFRTMQDDALEKIADGLTSLEEVMRVVPVDTTTPAGGVCPECSRDVTPGFRYCPFCGVPQPEEATSRTVR